MYDAPPPPHLPEPSSEPHPSGAEPAGRAFTDLFVRRPVLALVVSLLILLIGLRCLIDLPVRQYPLLENTVIEVTTSYPGATASLMQGFITQPLEQAVASAEGIDYMTSSSSTGQSTIDVYIRLNYDPDRALTEVMSKVNQVKYLIPKESNDPVITKQTGEQIATMYISFTSDTMSNSAVADFLSRSVQPTLATVPGVSSADVQGAEPFAMRLWLDPRRMAAHGVTAEDISAAITTNNFQAAPGQVKGYFTVTDVNADTGLTSVAQFRDMVVKAKGDQLVRMGDVAEVQLDAQAYDFNMRVYGHNAAVIAIKSTPDGNTLDIVKGVRAVLPEIQRNLLPGIEMKVQYDATEFIRASIHEVVTTLVEAILIVVVVIFLFLGSFRSIAIPVVTIPLSLIGAGIIMAALGFSLNLLTMLAMVLAIGLVVDDAIVVVENVHRWMELGRSPVQAALIGAREIAGPVIAMTLTLAAVYAPIGFLGGLTGVLFREFAFTLAGAVIISGIVALTLSPMMCSLLLTPETQSSGFARLIDRAFRRVTGVYAWALDLALGNRWLIGLFAGAVVASTVFMFLHTQKELAPDEDQGFLFTIVKGPDYANLDYTSRVIHQIDQIYRAAPETISDFLGAGDGTPNKGFGGLIMKPWDQRTRKAPEIQAAIQNAYNREISGARAFIISPPPLPDSASGLPIQMVISSTGDYSQIYQVMEALKRDAQKSGLFLVVDSDLDFDSPVIKLTVDHAKANMMGLSMQSIGDTLALMAGGNYVNRFTVGGRGYEVIPQVPRADRFNARALSQYYVNSRNGVPIPLSTVVSASHATEPNALVRYNQLNSATLSALSMPGTSMGDAVKFLEEEAHTLLPVGFYHDYLSTSRQYVREGNQLTTTFVFALIVIFLVLAAQFESLRDPLVVMVSVPMSICGALIPLFFWIVTLNIYTQVGLVTLIGLISKHGILMVEFARELQIREGLDRRAAIERAAQVRLRPILMTTAAMVVGLLPLVFATGAGAVSRLSIGIVIVSGMTIGTLFTLFVLPAVYTVLAKDHRADLKTTRAQEIAAMV